MSDSWGYFTPVNATWVSGRLVCCEFVAKVFELITPVGGSSTPFVFSSRSTGLGSLRFRSSSVTVTRNTDGLLLASDSASVNTDITSGQYGAISYQRIGSPPQFVSLSLPEFSPSQIGAYAYSRTGVLPYGINDFTPYVLDSFSPGDELSVSFLSRQARSPSIDVLATWSGIITPQDIWEDAVYAFDRVITNAVGEVDYAASIQSAGGLFYTGECAGLVSVSTTLARVDYPSGVRLEGGTIYYAGNHRLSGTDTYTTRDGLSSQSETSQGCSNLNVPCTGAVAVYPNIPTIFGSRFALLPFYAQGKQWQSERDLDLDQSCAP